MEAEKEEARRLQEEEERKRIEVYLPLGLFVSESDSTRLSSGYESNSNSTFIFRVTGPRGSEERGTTPAAGGRGAKADRGLSLVLRVIRMSILCILRIVGLLGLFNEHF